jgi:membrane protein DedA with SNARE-associated domain
MSIASLAGSPLVLCLGLFLMSLLHEETAMIAGGFLVSDRGLPFELVTAVLIAGLIAGDWGIFGLGVAARHVPRLARWLDTDPARRSRDWLDRHLLLVVTVARLFPGPGILFPTFSTLGLIGVSFPRFAFRSAAVAALYAPAMLYLTALYGDVVVPRIGWWGWPALLALSIAAFGGPWARPLRRWLSDLVGMQRSR